MTDITSTKKLRRNHLQRSAGFDTRYTYAEPPGALVTMFAVQTSGMHCACVHTKCRHALRMRSHKLESDARFCCKSPPPPPPNREHMHQRSCQKLQSTSRCSLPLTVWSMGHRTYASRLWRWRPVASCCLPKWCRGEWNAQRRSSMIVTEAKTTRKFDNVWSPIDDWLINDWHLRGTSTTWEAKWEVHRKL